MIFANSAETYPIKYLRSSDLLNINYEKTASNIIELPWLSDWLTWNKKRLNKIKSLANIGDFDHIFERLNFMTNRVPLQFMNIVNKTSFSIQSCDYNFHKSTEKVSKDYQLLLQLFDPIDLNQQAHFCLSKVQSLYRRLLADQLFQLKMMTSLDWGYKYPTREDLLLFLWSRRNSWTSFIADQWHDITDLHVKSSSYSSLVHQINFQRSRRLKSKQSESKVIKVAIVNFDLLRLMHPSIWRYYSLKSKYIAESVKFRDFLKSNLYAGFRDVFQGEKISRELERRFEQYLSFENLKYLSATEQELLDVKIQDDLSEIISTLKTKLNLDELILSNLIFPWETESLNAFRSVLKANVPNQTITAIKLLHLKNKVNPKLTQHMTKMIVGEELLF